MATMMRTGRGWARALREELGIGLGDEVDADRLGDNEATCARCGGPLVLVSGTSWIRAFTQLLWVHARPADYHRAPHHAAPGR